MTDEQVRTQVRTDDGWLEFQDYFVRRHQAPDVHEVRFDGIEAAPPTEAVLAALAGGRPHRHRAVESDRLGRADPRGARDGRALEAARGRGVPVVAVSGIVGGRALKGPADRMLASLGHESARWASPGSRRRRTRSCSTTSMPALGRRSRPSAYPRSSRTRSWPTTPAAPGWRARRAGLAARRCADDAAPAAPTRGSARSSRSRPIEGAKTRLGGTLDAEERQDLVSGCWHGAMAAA